MPSTIFQRVRFAAGLAALLSGIAVLRYSGGSRVDRASAGYSITHNFLSDLGMTVAYGGKANTLSACLFVVSLTAVVLGFAATLVGFIRIHSSAATARRLAHAAGAIGLFVCIALIGVALTPENRALSLHLRLTELAFRAFPAVPMLLATACLHDNRVPRKLGLVWALLAVVLVSYLCLIGWGPKVETSIGLVVQVLAQKAVAIAAVVIIVYQSYEAERLLVKHQTLKITDASSARRDVERGIAVEE